MATYIPNATLTTEPTEDQTVESAALEFRTLKGSVNARIDAVQAELDATQVQLAEERLQYLRVPESSTTALPAVAARAGKLLAFDELGQPTTALPVADSSTALRADLAATTGSSLVGHDGGTVQDVLDSAKPMQSYTALRAYTGRATAVRITGVMGTAQPQGIAGVYQYDDADTTTADNGWGCVVDVLGRRFKRQFTGAIKPEWTGADKTGVADCTAQIQSILSGIGDGAEIDFGSGEFLITGPLTANSFNLTLSAAGGYSKGMLRCITPGVQMLTVTGFGFKTKNFVMRGDGLDNGLYSTVKGIKFLRANGSADVDAEIDGGAFTGFVKTFECTGNNLFVHDALIASGLMGVDFIRNGSDESRGLRVINNRFHSMGSIGLAAVCVNVNAYAIASEVDRNHGDSIHTFYIGPINGITVDGNILYRVSGPGIETLTATNTTQQRCGSVSLNTIYANAPSYIGSGITLRMQNGRAVGNSVIGPRGHGIMMLGTTGSLITDNTILAHNFNLATDGAIYDGIYADAASTGNLIEANHIRSAGTVGRSAINIVSENNIVGVNYVDTAYANPYAGQKPVIVTTTTGVGIKKIPERALDIAGRSMRIQQPDSVSGSPVEYQAAFVNAAAAEIQSSSIKTVVRANGAGTEKADIEHWTMTNGTMTKQMTVKWNGGITYTALNAAPSGPETHQVAMSDGTPGTASWGASGAGLYRWSGSAWVFVG